MAHPNNALGALIADILGDGVMLETTIAKKTLQLDPRKLPNAALLDLLRYGTQRRFNDATGGSDKTPEEKWQKAEEMIAGYYDGVLTSRRAGGGVDELTRIMRQLARNVLKQKWDKDEYKARVTDAEEGDLAKLLDKVIAKAPEMFREKAEAELAAKRKEEAEKAKLAAALDFDL